MGFWLRHHLVKWRGKNLPSALKHHAAIKFIGHNSGKGIGWKESKKELWAEFRGCNETCTCCHSLTTPDFPGSVDLNQTGLWPSLADVGLFLPTSTQSKTCASVYVHAHVCAWVCHVRFCWTQTGKGDLEEEETDDGGVEAGANYFSLENAMSRFPDICNWRVVFSSLFWSNPQN